MAEVVPLNQQFVIGHYLRSTGCLGLIIVLLTGNTGKDKCHQCLRIIGFILLVVWFVLVHSDNEKYCSMLLPINVRQ